MPRRPRNEGPGAIHHVVAQGNGRCRIVHDRTDADRLWRGLAIVARQFRWSYLAACLLGTHLHALVRTEDANLGTGMQRLLGGYGRWFNLRHGREGHLLRSPFWSRRILTRDHALVGTSYVLLNPVRAGLCDHPRDWPWSTYRETAGLEPPRTGCSDGLLRSLGNDDVERGRAELLRVIEDDLRRWRAHPGRRDPRLAYLEELDDRGATSG